MGDLIIKACERYGFTNKPPEKKTDKTITEEYLVRQLSIFGSISILKNEITTGLGYLTKNFPRDHFIIEDHGAWFVFHIPKENGMWRK